MITKGYVCGIDVGSEKLDVALYRNAKFIRVWTVENSIEGITELVKELRPLSPKLAVMESTGGYEVACSYQLHDAGIPISVVNPQQARSFAKSMGKRAKQDTIDAKMLAEFGVRGDLKPKQLKSKEKRAFAAILERRQDLVKMRTSEKNRLETGHDVTTSNIEAHIDVLTQWIKEMEAQMRDMAKTIPDWVETAEILSSMPGIGDISKFTLLSEMEELGALTGKEITALAGLVPYNHDSGKLKGRRMCSGGRENVRTILYNACLSAIVHAEPLRNFYQKKRAEGKVFKVAMVAAMRKLLTILNAMVRDRKPFQLAVEG